MSWEDTERVWSQSALDHTLTCLMLDPITSDVRGELPIEPDGTSLDEGYETDARVSATIATVDPDSYIELSRLQLIHSVPSLGWREIQGTFYVVDLGATYQDGEHSCSYDCRSAMWTLGMDKDPYPYTIGTGGKALSAIGTLLTNCGRPYRFVSPNDKRYGSPRSFDAGSTIASIIFGIAGDAGDRVEQHPEGDVVIKRYVNPHDMTPTFWLGDDSPLVIDDGVKLTSDALQLASATAVTYKSGDTQRTGVAYPKATSKASHARRGWSLVEIHTTDDDPGSQSAVDKLARTYLSEDDTPTNKWDVHTLWFPVHEGDVGMYNGSKVLVHEARKSYSDMTIDLTLKEV